MSISGECISVHQLSAAYIMRRLKHMKPSGHGSAASIWPWIMPASVDSSAASRPKSSRTAGIWSAPVDCETRLASPTMRRSFAQKRTFDW